MAIAFKQIAEIFHLGTGTNVIVVLSTVNRTLGDRNAVLVNWYQPSQGATLGVISVTDTDGNTYAAIGAAIFDGNFGVHAWECKSIKAGTGTNTVTITLDGGSGGGCFNGAGCTEYSGSNPSAASYGYVEHSSGSGGSIGVSLTPATVGDVLVGWFGITSGSTTAALNTLRGTIQSNDSLWDEFTSTSLAAHSVGGVAGSFGCVVGVVIPQAVSSLKSVIFDSMNM